MIYKFDPILLHTIWGSELWVLSGCPGRVSRVKEGEFKGLSINELISLKKQELVGKAVYDSFGDEFPLLVKFIDAHDDLSIQVHPDEELAQKRHHCHGKTEMWYVINAEENAHLYAGLSKQISPEEYERRVKDDTIVEILAEHKAKQGDVFFLPAGRIHAICGGIYIAEIQQSSDITYRIYDYSRKGADGKLRELHTELAKDAIDYHVHDNYKTPYEKRENSEIELVKCPYFTTSLYELSEPVGKDLSRLDSFMLVMCIEGGGSVNGIDIKAGEVLLCDALTNGLEFVPKGKMKILTIDL